MTSEELCRKVEKTLIANGCKKTYHNFRYGYAWKGQTFYDYGFCFAFHFKKNLNENEACFIADEEVISDKSQEELMENISSSLVCQLSGLEVKNISFEFLRGRSIDVHILLK